MGCLLVVAKYQDERPQQQKMGLKCLKVLGIPISRNVLTRLIPRNRRIQNVHR